MTAESDLSEAVSRAGMTAPFRYDDVTESTNATALTLAASGFPEWTIVAAGHQTKGRGRLGRTWTSIPGAALQFSIVLRPEIDPESAGLLTLLAGACMSRAARTTGGAAVRCKWPNDLLVDAGKAGGILAESKVESGRVKHVVVGIGVNVTASPPNINEAAFLGGAGPPVLLEAFLRDFASNYRPASPEFAEKTLALYRPVSATIGRKVRATTTDGREVEGRAEDVDVRGNLLVDSAASIEAVAFGEVAHLD
ncbi:MAG: biotin--[acetyl-CoA-carboxylase] ligase [Actinomycetota bacterium]